MPNIRDVAELAGVSASTVSRVLNNSMTVRADTYQRIIGAAASLSYPLHSDSASKQTHVSIGIILPRAYGENIESHPNIYEILTSFIAAVKRRGADAPLLLMTDENKADIPAFLGERLSGYLILGTNSEQEDKLLDYFIPERIPYIIVNRWIERAGVNYVNTDDIRAAFEATEHLILHGHRNIAFICGEEHYRHSSFRLRGYKNAFEKYGLPVRNEYILHGDYSEIYGYIVGSKLLSLPERPSAAFTTSDSLAIGLQRCFIEHGISMPDEFAIASFGNTRRSATVTPALTTVDVPSEAMGTESAEMLLMLIGNRKIRSVQILMDAELLIRESSGGVVKDRPSSGNGSKK